MRDLTEEVKLCSIGFEKASTEEGPEENGAAMGDEVAVLGLEAEVAGFGAEHDEEGGFAVEEAGDGDVGGGSLGEERGESTGCGGRGVEVGLVCLSVDDGSVVAYKRVREQYALEGNPATKSKPQTLPPTPSLLQQLKRAAPSPMRPRLYRRPTTRSAAPPHFADPTNPPS